MTRLGKQSAHLRRLAEKCRAPAAAEDLLEVDGGGLTLQITSLRPPGLARPPGPAARPPRPAPCPPADPLKDPEVLEDAEEPPPAAGGEAAPASAAVRGGDTARRAQCRAAPGTAAAHGRPTMLPPLQEILVLPSWPLLLLRRRWTWSARQPRRTPAQPAPRPPPAAKPQPRQSPRRNWRGCSAMASGPQAHALPQQSQPRARQQEGRRRPAAPAARLALPLAAAAELAAAPCAQPPVLPRPGRRGRRALGWRGSRTGGSRMRTV